MAPKSSPGGLYASLKGLFGSSLGILQNRLELLGIELAEERQHLLALLGLCVTGVVFLSAGLILFATLITLVFWETHRLLVLGLFSSSFLLLGFLLIYQAIRHPRLGSSIFSSSLAELHKDQAALAPEDAPPAQ
jgi:uncharacterized membrane protein YqjE